MIRTHLEDLAGTGLPALLACAVAGWDDCRPRNAFDSAAAVSEAISTPRTSNDNIAEFLDDPYLLNRLLVIAGDQWPLAG